jgi:hypothetical protein
VRSMFVDLGGRYVAGIADWPSRLASCLQLAGRDEGGAP